MTWKKPFYSISMIIGTKLTLIWIGKKNRGIWDFNIFGRDNFKFTQKYSNIRKVEIHNFMRTSKVLWERYNFIVLHANFNDSIFTPHSKYQEDDIWVYVYL